MANWFYYDSFDFKQGPITQEDLQSLVAQGIITPQTKMETEDGKQGFAGQIKGLFPQQPAPPLQNYPPQYSPPAGIKPPADYLVWSVITTLCCCLPLGIVAIIMSVQAKSAFQLGDYAGAESKSKVAFWCNLIGLIMGSLIVGFNIIIQLAAVTQ